MKSRSVWHGSQMYPWPWTCSGTWRGGRQRSKATRSPSQYSTHQARSTWPTPPRAGGCGGSHHPLERSATDGSVEARTSPGCGLHRGLEAGRADTKKIKVGPGLDSTTQLGPLVSDEQQRRVLSYLDSGFSEDAKAVVRGRISEARATLWSRPSSSRCFPWPTTLSTASQPSYGRLGVDHTAAKSLAPRPSCLLTRN
jgi:hypothetical protein